MIFMDLLHCFMAFMSFLKQERELEKGKFEAKVMPMVIYTAILIALTIMLVVSLYIAI